MNELLEMIAVYRKYTGLLEEKISLLEKGAERTQEETVAAPLEAVRIVGVCPPSLPPQAAETSAEKNERKQFAPQKDHPQKIDGKKLKVLRIAKGIKTTEMATKLGCHPSSINAWEAGKWQPSQELKDKIIMILGCQQTDLTKIAA